MTRLGPALVVLAAPLAAQESVPVRYAPVPGATVTTVTEVTTVSTLTGFPAVPDGAQFEEHMRVYATQRVESATDAGWLVAMRVDSVRTRWRPAGGQWRDRPTPPLDGQSARVAVDPRLSVMGIESAGEHAPGMFRVLTGWTAGLGFAFPQTRVTVGAGFETGGRIPFHASLSLDTASSIEETLFGDLGLVLDSLTAREADTLLHFSYRGTFTPRQLQQAGEDEAVEVGLTGAFAGRLIWSTGWDAFVSGAGRYRTAADVIATSAAGAVQATVEWHTDVVHRLRP